MDSPTQRRIRLLRGRGRLPYGPPVANRTQVLLLIAAVTGLNPMTVELILRYLGKVGLVPKGLPGRRSAHYSTEHLKNLILALAAYQPSESVEAVQKLNDLHCNTNALANLAFSPEIPAISKGVLFGNWIMAEIEARISRTEPELAVAEQEAPPELRRGRTITMSIIPPSTFTTRPVYGADGTVQFYTDYFMPKDPLSPTTPALRRQTTFTDELLNAAGDLLADTLATQAATSIPDPVPGRTGEGDAAPETTKAAGSGNHDGLLFEHPATQTRRRRPLNKAQPIASQGRKQSRPDGAVSELRGSYPPAAKDHYNGTLWTDAAPP